MVELARPCVLPVPEGSHFPVQNLPFGTFRRRSGDTAPHTGVRIGDNVLDMARMADAGCFQGQQLDGFCFHQVPKCSPWHASALHMWAWRLPLSTIFVGRWMMQLNCKVRLYAGQYKRVSGSRTLSMAPGTLRTVVPKCCEQCQRRLRCFLCQATGLHVCDAGAQQAAGAPDGCCQHAARSGFAEAGCCAHGETHQLPF